MLFNTNSPLKCGHLSNKDTFTGPKGDWFRWVPLYCGRQWSALTTAESILTPLYLSNIIIYPALPVKWTYHFIGDHYDELDLLLPHHLPEIRTSVLHGALRYHKVSLLIVNCELCVCAGRGEGGEEGRRGMCNGS